jgi:hypothetical protein
MKFWYKNIKELLERSRKSVKILFVKKTKSVGNDYCRFANVGASHVTHSGVVNPRLLQVQSLKFSPNNDPKIKIEITLQIVPCIKGDVERWLHFFKRTWNFKTTCKSRDGGVNKFRRWGQIQPPMFSSIETSNNFNTTNACKICTIDYSKFLKT